MIRSHALLITTLTIFLIITFWGTATALAQNSPVAQNCSATLVTQGLPPISMLLEPNGTGTPLSVCYDATGAMVNAWISVTLRDAAGSAVTNVPATDVRLEEIGSPLAWCGLNWYPPPAHAPNLADVPSNAIGQTSFTLSYHGGGWIQGPIFVWVLEASGAWNPIPMPVNTYFNSVDINGDLLVNLTDVTLFTADFFGAPQYRSDFNNDGAINLTDLTLLAPHIGASCP